MSPALARLRQGLLEPSGASLVGMILFAIAEAGAFAALATPRHVAELPVGVLMNGARDDYARLTILALELRYRQAAPLSVVYLGPSAAQRALYDSLDPRPIERALSRAAGEPVKFWSLYAGGETVEESARLVQQLPDHFRGVVVIVVLEDKDDDRSKRLALRQNARLEERLPLDPPAGEERRAFDGRVLRNTGIYFYDHLQFFSARRAQLLHPWQTWAPLGRGGISMPTPPPYGSERDTFETRYKPNPMPLLRRHLGLLADTVSTAAAHGANVVLLEAPENPLYRQLKGEEHTEYVRKIRDFAEEMGVEYWDINDEVGAKQRDFEDAIHLGAPEARQRFESVFVRRLGARLQELTRKEPRPEE